MPPFSVPCAKFDPFFRPVEQLLGIARKTPRTPGPVGKARQIFERVSQLPRATQQRILANVEDALTAHEVRKAS